MRKVLVFLFFFLISVNLLELKPSINFNSNQESYLELGNTEIQFPIFIDDSDPNYNWTKTVAENDWCTGGGTWGNPYIIENLTIDGTGTLTYCIEIKNSNAYFIIRNCITFNTRTISPNAGIRLENTNNGKIENNDCSNSNYGVSLKLSHNNSIISNDLIENSVTAITLNDCNYTSMKNNWLHLNERGFWIDSESYHNLVENNFVRYNEGIVIFGSDNLVINNTFDRCYPGIRMDSGSFNNISYNYIYSTYSSFEAISLKDAHFNKISKNLILGQLIGSSHYNGIKLDRSRDNIVNNNYIYNMHSRGIYLLEDSSNNEIYKNYINNCPYGIYSVESNDLIVLGNDITKSDDIGLYLISSEHSILIDNNISLNSNGIRMEKSNYTNIELNMINNNDYSGIELSSESHYNYFMNNTINNNKDGIKFITSNNNEIYNNTLKGNINCIVEINSVGNQFEYNTCENRIVYDNGTDTISSYSFFFIIAIIVVVMGIIRKIKRIK